MKLQILTQEQVCLCGVLSSRHSLTCVIDYRRIPRTLSHVYYDPITPETQAELDKIFRAAGFEWREPGCSMCLAMNPDKLVGDQLCASSSNRNFKGRQGSPTGRTLLMSPAMVAAAALRGAVADVREIL